MIRESIGVNLDDLRLEARKAIERAESIGFTGVEFGAATGEFDAQQLSISARRHIGKFIESRGMRILALTADPPGLRWTDSHAVSERFERTARVIDLARDLRVSVVSTAASSLTHPETGEPSPVALEALARIGELADARSVAFAVRVSSEKVESVNRVLNALRCPALRVGLDPAALIMSGNNPMAYVERYVRELPLVYVRDGVVGGSDRPGQEVSFGEGDVDWNGILAVLEAAEWNGALIARCQASTNPTQALSHTRAAFLAGSRAGY